MDTPQLIINADAKKIAEQIEAWSEIVQLSTQIQIEVNDTNISKNEHWPNVLSLADKRDKLVENFFEGGVSQLILPQIIEDLESIKEQHLEIMSELTKRDAVIEIDETFLKNAKEQINILSTPLS